MSVNYPLEVDVHGRGILVLPSLALEPCHGPWDSCGCCCVQGIDATVFLVPIRFIHVRARADLVSFLIRAPHENAGSL